MKYGKFFLLIGCSLIFSHIGSAQWKHAEGNLPSWGVLDAIDAVDSMTAAVAIRTGYLYPFDPKNYSSYPVAITTDGGVSWTLRKLPFDFGAFDLAMTDANHLWIVGGTGSIYASIDGGKTWTLQFSDTSKTKFLNYIEMFNASEGVAMGDGDWQKNTPPVFLHTSDGGATWKVTLATGLPGVISGDMWRELDFVDKNTGFFCRTKNGTPREMMKTTDGGATWTPILFPENKTGLALKFYNASIGLAAISVDTVFNSGVNGVAPWICRTKDGGASWEFLKVSDGKGWGEDFEFVPGDPAKIWYTSYHEMFFSSDTGRTWVKQAFDSVSVHGRDIKLVPGGAAWFGCDFGVVYRATKATNINLLQTGVEHLDSKIPAAFTLSQNYPNPFNPTTTIEFALPHSGRTSVKIYSLLGSEIATLIDGELQAGTHRAIWDAKGMASGMYICRLQSGEFLQSRIMTLLK